MPSPTPNLAWPLGHHSFFMVSRQQSSPLRVAGVTQTARRSIRRPLASCAPVTHATVCARPLCLRSTSRGSYSFGSSSSALNTTKLQEPRHERTGVMRGRYRREYSNIELSPAGFEVAWTDHRMLLSISGSTALESIYGAQLAPSAGVRASPRECTCT